jgi:hypothetical protein
LETTEGLLFAPSVAVALPSRRLTHRSRFPSLHCSGDFDDNSGVYTVPVSGVYYVQTHLRVVQQSKASGCTGLIRVTLEVNGDVQGHNGQTSFDSNPPCYGTTEVVQGMGYYRKGDRVRG